MYSWQYMHTKRRDIVNPQTVSCLCKITISTMLICRWKRHELWTCTNYYRGHTPHSKQRLWFQLSVQWRHSHSAWTLLPDYWSVWQWTEPASCFARGSVASASASLAGLSKCRALLRQSFDNVSLAVAMAQGITATLLCAHSPTILTNPEP